VRPDSRQILGGKRFLDVFFARSPVKIRRELAAFGFSSGFAENCGFFQVFSSF
jgi:hypothetical protein